LVGLDSANESILIEKLDKPKLKQIFPARENLKDICRLHLSEKDGQILKEKYEWEEVWVYYRH